MIAAISENNALGKDNKLIFKIPEDMKRFKEVTSGHPIIMGRKTYESIGRPLPNRTNIVVTRDKNYKAEGCEVVYSLEQAIEVAKKVEKTEVFVIGGGQIYKEAIKMADKLYLTVVEGKYYADTFFPDYSDFKKVIHSDSHESAGYKYKFLDLEK
ncbi:dihydrofolate reductase [Patescibacteria group bacterium]|nr:dihydrofolate reductase [Patescibacteria group bacterium]